MKSAKRNAWENTTVSDGLMFVRAGVLAVVTLLSCIGIQSIVHFK